MASGKYLPTSSSRQVPAGKYLCSRKYLHKYWRAQMPPRDKRGPPAILPSRPWPRYLGFVMLTSRAWFPSSPSCEPELGIRNAVRVVNERPRGVGKYLRQVFADKYLPTRTCRISCARASTCTRTCTSTCASVTICRQLLADKYLWASTCARASTCTSTCASTCAPCCRREIIEGLPRSCPRGLGLAILAS
jgi:hypothetical protein